jgi:hypothetical protein
VQQPEALYTLTMAPNNDSQSTLDPILGPSSLMNNNTCQTHPSHPGRLCRLVLARNAPASASLDWDERLSGLICSKVPSSRTTRKRTFPPSASSTAIAPEWCTLVFLEHDYQESNCLWIRYDTRCAWISKQGAAFRCPDSRFPKHCNPQERAS